MSDNNINGIPKSPIIPPVNSIQKENGPKFDSDKETTLFDSDKETTFKKLFDKYKNGPTNTDGVGGGDGIVSELKLELGVIAIGQKATTQLTSKQDNDSAKTQVDSVQEIINRSNDAISSGIISRPIDVKKAYGKK